MEPATVSSRAIAAAAAHGADADERPAAARPDPPDGDPLLDAVADCHEDRARGSLGIDEWLVGPLTTLMLALVVGFVVVGVCSWQRNRSIFWAILAGLLSWLYVVYFAITRRPEETRGGRCALLRGKGLTNPKPSEGEFHGRHRGAESLGGGAFESGCWWVGW